MSRPNVLVIMTDEERYPPPYEQEALRAFRRDQLPARVSLLTYSQGVASAASNLQ